MSVDAILTGCERSAKSLMEDATTERLRALRVQRRCRDVQMWSGVLYPLAIWKGSSWTFWALLALILLAGLIDWCEERCYRFALRMEDHARHDQRRLAFCREHEDSTRVAL